MISPPATSNIRQSASPAGRVEIRVNPLRYSSVRSNLFVEEDRLIRKISSVGACRPSRAWLKSPAASNDAPPLNRQCQEIVGKSQPHHGVMSITQRSIAPVSNHRYIPLSPTAVPLSVLTRRVNSTETDAQILSRVSPDGGEFDTQVPRTTLGRTSHMQQLEARS
jgi:hypothetical protein